MHKKPTKNPWRTLSSKIAHQNPWFKISEHKVKRPDGTPGTYFVLRNTPAVFMVAVTPKMETFLVGLWRYPTSQFSWEIPGGGSEGQKPLLAAKRELLEEAGIIAKKWKLVGKFQSFNGMSDEISYTYVATELTFSKNHSQKEEGIAAIKKVSLRKALEMIKKGEITDGQTITSITQAALYLGIIK